MLRSSLKLRCGRTVTIRSLRQWSVYAGLLEGLPTRERNEESIARIVQQSRDADRHEPFLITPTQTPIKYDGSYSFGEPASLPSICCVAHLHHFGPARDSTMDCSDLTVIWFQDDFAFPIDEAAHNQLLSLDWTALAEDSGF